MELERKFGVVGLAKAAEYLGVHRNTLSRWVHAGMIPVDVRGRPGSSYKFRLSEIRAWWISRCERQEAERLGRAAMLAELKAELQKRGGVGAQ